MRLLVIRSSDMAQAQAFAALTANGFNFDQFTNLADADEALAFSSYAGILLARRLSDGCGATWLARQRSCGLTTPVIVVTPSDEIDDRIRVLDAGADDCVLRAITGRELLARLRAVLRRPPALAVAMLEYGNVRMNTTERQVWVADQPIAIPRREMDLLEHLLSRGGRVVPRAMLESNLYGLSEDVSPNSIEVRISRVRRHLSQAGATVTVRTMRGIGYMLEPVENQAGRVMRVASLALLLVAGCVLPLGPAWAQVVTSTIRLSASEGRMVRMPRPPTNVLLADPTIADIAMPTPSQAFLIGKKPGRTTLFALDAQGGQIGSWQVVVGISDADLRELVRTEIGDYPVRVAFTPTGAVLSGTVPSPRVAERVRAIAARFLPEGQAIVNNLQVSGSIQVRLRVRVAEVSRSTLKQLGINWDAVGAGGNFAVGLLTGRAVLNAAGGVARAATGSLFGQYNSGRTNVTGVIDALASESLVQVLAEPTLIAASGETAKFLAGGQFPVPISQGLNQISVEYKNFGVGLEFTPTVLSDDLISMRVTPEVSTLVTDTAAGAIVTNGFTIPGLSVRRAETTVELGTGQSFAIGGLLQNNVTSQVSRYPGLGDIPVLGVLFRSTQFQRNETELVIIVTPTIVRPAAGPGALRSPTDAVSAPSDIDRLLRGQLSRAPAGQAALDQIGSARLGADAGFVLE